MSPLVVCPTPIGNLADVTLRSLDELRSADLVACEDTRHTRGLLDRHGIEARTLSLNEHNEAARIPELLRRLRDGQRVVLVSDAGTPVLSDPGARLLAAAIAAGFEPVVLPGASAVTTAAVASALTSGGFAFVGFLPRAAGRLRAAVERAGSAGLAVVAFESPRRLPATLRLLAGWTPERRAAVCRELTKLHEQVERGTLAELAERLPEPPKGEVVLVLAPVELSPAAAPTGDLEALRELSAMVGARRAAGLAARLTGGSRNAFYLALTSPSANAERHDAQI
ncbi:MAG TPA: 16S rRNA (cytidine(1402)-2'-O)-methyltransferase [Gaiellales bacterium]|nr:16S rRNA (cytidine(1402)-2'-O)-methyltransferase [Gaiellales bacterium]